LACSSRRRASSASASSARQLLPQLHLGRTEAAQLRAELTAARGTGIDPRAERCLEMRDRDLERSQEALGQLDTPVGEGIPLDRVGRVRDRLLEPRAELVELGRKRTPAGLQLEQHRLGGLAGEPELAALGVVAEALRRHGPYGRGEQLLLRDDRRLRDELFRIAADEHHKTAETRVSSSLEQRQRSGCVVPDDRGGRAAECGRDGALAAGLDLEQRVGDPLAVLRERACRRWQAFALGQRPVEHAQATLEQADLVRQGCPLGTNRLVEDATRSGKRVTKPKHARLHRLAPQLEALGRAAKPIESL
jgi:hypothetical protein